MIANVKKLEFERHLARTEILYTAHHLEKGNIDVAINRCESALKTLYRIKESEGN